MHRLTLRIRVALAALPLLAGCAPSAVAPEPSAALALSDCREPGFPSVLRCGTLQVAEDPAQPDGRQIDLKIVVWPARSAPAREPVYFLAGGPGQGATEVMPQVGFLREANEHHDIVFADMRGTGGSHKLACEVGDDATVAERLELDAGIEELDDCLAELDADPRQYTTPRLVADLDAVRRALGHAQINLYGGSYGTRLGLAYLAAHGEQVRAAVLDGLAPYAMKLFLTFGVDGKRALDRLFADCRSDEPCATAFPDLEARFWSWLDDLEVPEGEPPRTVTLRDPRTGERTLDLPLNRDAVASAIRGLLYSAEVSSLLPLALHHAAEGDPEPLIAQALVLGDGGAQAMATGLMLSVVCAEEIPRFTEAERAALADEPFLRGSLVEMLVQACSRWPVGDVPASLFEPVASDVPVLLLSGAEDPVTPSRWAEEAARTLTRARSVVVPATGHIAAGAGCVDERIASFYDDPEAPLDLEAPCVAERQRPPFFIDFVGPTP